MAEASSPERLAGRHSGRINGGSEQPKRLVAGIQGESSTRKPAADILVEPFKVVFHQDSRKENLSGALYGAPSTMIHEVRIMVERFEKSPPPEILIRRSWWSKGERSHHYNSCRGNPGGTGSEINPPRILQRKSWWTRQKRALHRNPNIKEPSGHCDGSNREMTNQIGKRRIKLGDAT